MILVYTLSLIPMLLITLVIHELGHLAVARILRIKPSRFQIGVGWNIINRYSGRTRIGITPETATIGAPAPEMRPGDLISVYVHREPGAERYTAAAILPQGEKRCSPEELEKVQQHGRTNMRLTGRIREATAEQLTLADMAWSLRAIPLMAGVIFPDDPNQEDAGSLQRRVLAPAGRNHRCRGRRKRADDRDHPGHGGDTTHPAPQHPDLEHCRGGSRRTCGERWDHSRRPDSQGPEHNPPDPGGTPEAGGKRSPGGQRHKPGSGKGGDRILEFSLQPNPTEPTIGNPDATMGSDRRNAGR